MEHAKNIHDTFTHKSDTYNRLKKQNFTQQIVDNIYRLWDMAFLGDISAKINWLEANLDQAVKTANGDYICDVSPIVDESEYPIYVCPLSWIFQKEDVGPLKIQMVNASAILLDYQPVQNIGRLTALTLALSLLERRFPGRYLFLTDPNQNPSTLPYDLNTKRMVWFDDRYPINKVAFPVFARRSHPFIPPISFSRCLYPTGDEHQYHRHTQQTLPDCVLVPPLIEQPEGNSVIIETICLAIQLEKIMAVVNAHLAPLTSEYLEFELLIPWQHLE